MTNFAFLPAARNRKVIEGVFAQLGTINGALLTERAPSQNYPKAG